MVDIKWERQNATTEVHRWKEYTFKKRLVGGNTYYEIWRNGVLCVNRLGYWQLVGKYEEITVGPMSQETSRQVSNGARTT